MKSVAFKSTLSIFVTAASIAMVAPAAQAEFLKFYTGDSAVLSIDDGAALTCPIGSVGCTVGLTSGGDLVSGSLTYNTSGGILTVTATTGNTFGATPSLDAGTAGLVNQDLVPPFGGLGVAPATAGSDTGLDNIGALEKLKLSFANPVTITDIVFYDQDHLTTFEDGLFLVSVDNAAWGGVGIPLVNLYSTNLTGSTFEFRRFSTAANSTKAFYVSALNIASVPEPGTIALLGIAAGALGWTTRRRHRLDAKASQ